MMTDLEQLENTEENKPTKVRLFLQQFGGKVASEEPVTASYKKKGRGSAKGFMLYTDITDQQSVELSKLEKWFKKRAEKFLDTVK